MILSAVVIIDKLFYYIIYLFTKQFAEIHFYIQTNIDLYLRFKILDFRFY